MRKITKFIGFRASEEERAALQRLAEREERNPSDVLRRLIRQASKEERASDRQDRGALSVSGP